MENVLKKLFDKLNSIYEKGYKEKKFIRYIYGRQFNYIYNYFNKSGDGEILPFLKFITNNQLENIVINKNLVKKEKFNKYKEVLYNIDSKIGQILEDNNITLKKIYENTIIKNKTYFENEESNGLYIYSGYKVEKELIQLYIYLTGNFPIAQNILICNKQTSNEEIMAFFYRAIFCDANSCFIIGGIESLNFNF